MRRLLPLVLAACGAHVDNADPVVTILEPLDHARPPEGRPTHFRIDVEDPGGTLPVQVTIADPDRVLHTSDALSVPTVYEVDVLIPTVARQVLTVTATDPDGGQGAATVEVDVNAVPTVPGIAITPTMPVAGEALEARIDVLARDASPLAYAWTWWRDEVPVYSGELANARQAAVVPEGVTVEGEVWRARFEAYELLGDVRDPVGTSSFGVASVTIGAAPDTDAVGP